MSRRQFLRAAVAGAIGLPFLETFAPRSAQAQEERPRRFIVMFSPNGSLDEHWAPAGTETEFTLSPILDPLAEHRADLVIVRGVDQQGAGGDGHQNGMSGMLTGAPLLPGRFAGQGVPPTGWASGPSVDQRIAEAIGRNAPFRSLELGVQVGAADNFGRMCYRTANRPLPPREDPRRVLEDLFGGVIEDPALREQRRIRRTSILDFVRSQIDALSAEVSAADRRSLDAHSTLLRELELRLEYQSQAAGNCDRPNVPAELETGNDAFPAIGALQRSLLVAALACGRTQVASLQWSRSVSQTRFTWLGIPEGHHDLSHRPDDDVDAQDKLVRINAWYAGRFAELISALKAVPEGAGTLFDSSLLLWCNELGRGNTHSRDNAPYVLAGSAGGALRTGRYLEYADVPHNDLLVSILNVMGVPDTSFGNPDWCSGPLTDLA